eukprot:963900-Alexandrium_andersonii.AAC.1
MSASLVGSEMCIRDRTSRGASGVTSTPSPRATTCGSAGQGPSCSVASPVSYTHLTLPTICSV